MKILVITRSEWDNKNSIGNTLSNIFGNINSNHIANISFRSDPPDNSICKKYHVLNEKILLDALKITSLFKKIKNLFKKKALPALPNRENHLTHELSLVKKFRGSQNTLPYLLQDLFWRLPWWKNAELHKFLEEFKPDIIFFPSFGMPYTHRAARYIAHTASASLVAFHADDYYFQIPTKNSVLKSFFYKIRAREIRKTISFAKANYAISEKQSELYSNYFNREFKILRKGINVKNYSPKKREEKLNTFHSGVRLLYAGSLEYGRWKTISLLVKAMHNLRSNGMNFTLDIYSQYDIKNEIRENIVLDGVSKFLGSILPNELPNKYADADLVLHVESFDKEDVELTKYSFSTKIIDCLGSSTCIFGFGPPNIASIEYLIENKLGIVCSDENSIEQNLSKIYGKFDIFDKLSTSARNFVIKNHDLDAIQKELNNDFLNIIKYHKEK